MSFRIPCPHCGAKLVLADDAVGKQKRCPKCRGAVRARVSAISVNDAEESDPPPEPDAAEHKTTAGLSWDEIAGRIIVAAGVIAAPFLWFSPPSLWAWLGGDVLIWLCSGLVVYRLWQRLRFRGAVPAAVVTGLAVTIAFHRTARFMEVWEAESGTRYTDWMLRSRTIYYREMWIGELGEKGSMHIEGPMSSSNKPHGHWTGFVWGGEDVDRWYWYGEEVTEGEFRLRSR